MDAAIFLYNILEGGEMRSREVNRLALDAGIVMSTLVRAKKLIGAKSRIEDGRWYMFIPEEARNRKEDIIKLLESKSFKELFGTPTEQRKISEDWVSVVISGDSDEELEEAPIREVTHGGLHIKAGAYEFTADASFPTDQLIALLKGLGVESIC